MNFLQNRSCMRSTNVAWTSGGYMGRKAVVLALLIYLVRDCRPVWAGNNVWTNLGPEGGSIHSISIDPRDPNTIYAGTEVGSFKSRDGGRSWAKSDIPSGVVVFDRQNPNVVYVQPRLNVAGDLLKSTDGGVNWKSAVPTRDPVADLVISFQDRNTMF